MREPCTHNWKEARRPQGWQLKQRGWAQHYIAETLDVSEGAISQWMTRPGREDRRLSGAAPHLVLRDDCPPTNSLNCPLYWSAAPKPMVFEDNPGPAAGSPPSFN